MDDAELQLLNDAIYNRHKSRAQTRWLEKRVIGLCRQSIKETVARLKAEQAAS
ncbi:hypothetical protein ACIRFF_08625 [Streptomyces cyaneofuscatus]